MNRNGANGTIGAMVFVAIASCAANANAQTAVSEPVGVAGFPLAY